MTRIVFDRSIGLTQNVILSHGARALGATIDRIDKLRGIVNAPRILSNAIDHPDIGPTLSDLCYQAGLASTILFNDSGKGKSESLVSYTLRMERIAYVKADLKNANVDVSVLQDRKLRNLLTHIDEHLADKLTQDAKVGWWIDTAIIGRTTWVVPAGITQAYCRCYCVDDDKILHFGHQLNVQTLRDQCVSVLAVVFGV